MDLRIIFTFLPNRTINVALHVGPAGALLTRVDVQRGAEVVSRATKVAQAAIDKETIWPRENKHLEEQKRNTACRL